MAYSSCVKCWSVSYTCMWINVKFAQWTFAIHIYHLLQVMMNKISRYKKQMILVQTAPTSLAKYHVTKMCLISGMRQFSFHSEVQCVWHCQIVTWVFSMQQQCLMRNVSHKCQTWWQSVIPWSIESHTLGLTWAGSNTIFCSTTNHTGQPTIFFKSGEHPSSFVCLTQQDALYFLVSSCFILCANRNHSHTHIFCLFVVSTLVDLNNILGVYY